MRLRVQAEQMDWDAAFAALDETAPDVVDDVDAADPEAERFEQLHALLHVAVQAVLEASDGEITYFE